ncbi:calcium-binding protein [Methylobacterium oryzihabitans]|uniref:Calcium-binding protein n=1 Tax=Methylobacterium oryzihabitans TaxID=2499852 RepID=A0A3S2YMK2_9HYPH|nr:calcium-binding protein [Methylobacterium oryzihabitans]RVU14933.1 calcium-binding protein [Methylobacterium oryzihabitans]
MAEIWGTSANDVLNGTSGADQISGLGGNDTVSAGDGNDTVIGGGGIDALYGQAGDDSLIGGDGDDGFDGGTGADWMDGGAGYDGVSYYYGATGLTLNLKTGVHTGEAAGDTFVSIEQFQGTRLNDVFVSGSEAKHFDGHDGFDALDYSTSAAAVSINLATGLGSGGDAEGDSYLRFEAVVGSAFNDTLTGAATSDVLEGGRGHDILMGSAGADELIGGLGTDTVDYSSANAAVVVNFLTGIGAGSDAEGDTYNGIERATGSAYDDTFISGAGANRFIGGNGLDAVDYRQSSAAVMVDLSTGTGQGGDAQGDTYGGVERIEGSAFGDTLISGVRSDALSGNAGNDILDGGTGYDTLIGGDGADVFRFSSAPGDRLLFTIAEFVQGTDKIELSSTAFNNLSVGTLSANDFSQYFAYDGQTGFLSYDADGSGQGASVRFAELTTHPSLSASDFVVV